jgi:hypothetical protein
MSVVQHEECFFYVYFGNTRFLCAYGTIAFTASCNLPRLTVATQRMAADELARKGVLNRFPRNQMLQQYALSPQFLPDA